MAYRHGRTGMQRQDPAKGLRQQSIEQWNRKLKDLRATGKLNTNPSTASLRCIEMRTELLKGEPGQKFRYWERLSGIDVRWWGIGVPCAVVVLNAIQAGHRFEAQSSRQDNGTRQNGWCSCDFHVKQYYPLLVSCGFVMPCVEVQHDTSNGCITDLFLLTVWRDWSSEP